MSTKIKNKLKQGSNRSFLAKDFEAFRTELITQAKIFFPDKIKDFSEPSVGGMLVDLAAAVGDTMSFYLDHQFKELDPQSAVEIDNITTHLRNAGVKIVGASPSVVKAVLSVKVTAERKSRTGEYEPRFSSLPVVLEATTLKADNGVIFNLTEDLDFAKKDVEGNLVASKNFVTFDGDGNPSECELTLETFAISGQETLESITLSDIDVPFREITLQNKDVSEILSIKDTDDNVYYEVESLSQDTVFVPVDNLSIDDFDTVPKTLEIVPAPRRFTRSTSIQTRLTTVRFGSGNSESLDDDIIPDPSELSLDLYGKKSFARFSIDPNSLLGSQTLGISPRGTTIKILYRHGGGLRHNIDAGTLKTIGNLVVEFRNSPDPVDALGTRQTIKCNNLEQARGGANAPGVEDLRNLIQSARNAQSRTVTRDDLLARIYTLPSKFGRVFRVGLGDNPTNPLSLLMYVISLDNNGNLHVSPDQLKRNLSKYLNEFRLISDAIDILDASVINVGIQYEVYVDKNSNKQAVLQTINRRISDAFDIKYFQIDQPLIIDDVVNLVINTDGVISLTDLKIYPITGQLDGRQYSNFSFPFEASTKKGIIRPPAGSIFELKFPENDIKGFAV